MICNCSIDFDYQVMHDLYLQQCVHIFFCWRIMLTCMKFSLPVLVLVFQAVHSVKQEVVFMQDDEKKEFVSFISLLNMLRVRMIFN
jgi:hypothetical protein